MVTFGFILLGFVALIGLLVFSLIHVDVLASERAAWLRLRWLGSRLSFHLPDKLFEYHLFSLRLFRKPLSQTKERRPKQAKPKRVTRTVSLGERLEQAKAAAGAGRYVLRHIRLEHLRAQATIATPDPALTGELFGYASGLQGALSALAPNVSLHVTPDFGQQVPRGQVDGSLHIRVVHLLIAAWRFGKQFLFKRRRKSVASSYAKGVNNASSRPT